MPPTTADDDARREAGPERDRFDYPQDALAAAQLEVKLLTAQRDQLLLKVEEMKKSAARLDMRVLRMSLVLKAVAEDMPESSCGCGSPPYENGLQCPVCQAIALLENLKDEDALLATPDAPEVP